MPETLDVRELLAAARAPVRAVRPMAVGGLTTVVVAELLSSGGNHALRTVEHVLLGYFVAELALELAAEGAAVGPVRGVEAAVLLPYAALVALAAVPVVGCGTGPLAALRGVLYDLHAGLALCRELVALEVLTGAGAAALVADRLPDGSSDGN